MKTFGLIRGFLFSFLMVLGGVGAWGQCPTGDIVLTTQGQVDSFGINYPGCTEVLGDLTIGILWSTNDINSLNGLQSLTSITGNLEILYNNSLNSLEGLNSLTSIGEGLNVGYNISLANLQGLGAITSIGEGLDVHSNYSLTNLQGLNALITIGGELNVHMNSLLTNFQGLDALTSIGGVFSVSENNSLTSFQGLESVTSLKQLNTISNTALVNFQGLNSVVMIEGSLYVDNNHNLIGFQGLNAVTTIGGFWVNNNNKLSNFQGLNALSSIEGTFYAGNNSIKSFDGLNSLTTIAAEFNVRNIDSLVNFEGLNSLTSIGNLINIENNNLLSSLQGLNALTSIGDKLFIYENDVLTDLKGLESLTHVGTKIIIWENISLSNCAFGEICQMLALDPINVLIQNNLAGCNTQEEVGMTCIGLSYSTGKTYIDINCNNQFDTITDQILPFQLLRNSANNLPIATTKANGNYIKFHIPNSTLEYFATGPQGFTVYPNSYTISTDTISQQFPNKDFRLCPDSLFHNLKTTLTSVTVPRPGFTNQYQICVQNLGTQPENAILSLDFSIGDDPLYITIVEAAGGTVQNNIITWNISNLQLFDSECFTVTVQIATNTPLGIYLQPKSNISLSPLQTETKYTDNYVELRDQVVGSYDPNDKTVDMPNIVYDPTSGVTRLQYKIRFQNTGTFPATFIDVLDTLESKLDIRTIEMVAASHDYTMSFPSPNVLKWRFDDINLPDSTSNEPGSHGFVVFNISTKTPINLGEVVQNRAGIYFDFNEPVITNYATTSFTVGVHDPLGLGSLPLSIAPNPTSDNITLRYSLTESADSELLITNAQGVVVQSQRLGKQGLGDYALPVDLVGLPAGLYLVRIRAGEQLGVGKVVVVR